MRIPTFFGSGAQVLAWGLILPVFLWSCAASGGEKTNCDIQNGPCTLAAPGCRVTLDIRPRPVRAMQVCSFRVEVEGKQPDSPPRIELEMPGMVMGQNRVRLKAAGENAYEGKGLMVRCTSGSRLWRAAVILPGACRVDFVFEVLH